MSGAGVRTTGLRGQMAAAARQARKNEPPAVEFLHGSERDMEPHVWRYGGKDFETLRDAAEKRQQDIDASIVDAVLALLPSLPLPVSPKTMADLAQTIREQSRHAEDMARLVEAARDAASQFQHYVGLHAVAGKIEKAETNQRYADLLARALAPFTDPTAPHQVAQPDKMMGESQASHTVTDPRLARIAAWRDQWTGDSSNHPTVRGIVALHDILRDLLATDAARRARDRAVARAARGLVEVVHFQSDPLSMALAALALALGSNTP